MLRLISHPSRVFATLVAGLLLSSVASAQTYTARAGASIAGNDDFSIASSPTVALWDGTWTHAVRHAWSQADQGILEGTALCQTSARYNMESYAIAQYQFDDLVFSSAGSGSIQVDLNLTIEGNSSVVNGNSFRVFLRLGLQAIGDAQRAADGTISTSGVLSGWNMSSPFSFTRTMTVPVNTPVSLKTYMAVTAAATSGGHNANGHYTLRLGGAAPVTSRGSSFSVFGLPPGVTVDSVEGGISNNLWSPPERLHLHADRDTIAPGESLALVPWNGVPGQPVGLVIGGPLSGSTPSFGRVTWSGFIGTLDGDGWLWLDPIPNSPALAGTTMNIRALSLNSSGRRVRSNQVVVQFQ